MSLADFKRQRTYEIAKLSDEHISQSTHKEAIKEARESRNVITKELRRCKKDLGLARAIPHIHPQQTVRAMRCSVASAKIAHLKIQLRTNRREIESATIAREGEIARQWREMKDLNEQHFEMRSHIGAADSMAFPFASKPRGRIDREEERFWKRVIMSSVPMDDQDPVMHGNAVFARVGKVVGKFIDRLSRG
ncbi:uncharacterized protein K489DRAFT_405632 [Dissoconium aciculare CBS 342.82]|uniref:Uncharacterized protein n=1 Tax=Dissoconium aciculare CBS 342.82 TaxID=1314786 RepID=A0A6J3MFU4_9PEZI|nr:uncharacterized protein K489DRAFT_405632 [Dissoconium aciculare CBS 342.82]KAF1826861.1 hypothetical protein K489DRAFT_405632 [Dissoconium aciculare CBS 342.82]